MNDYYAILGLERSASRESVKIAYRQLARETHPDRKALSSEAERAKLSQLMAQLNEAFAVLYDVKQRREYDEQLRLEEVLVQKTNQVPKNDTSLSSSSGSGRHSRVGPRRNLDSNLVSEFSSHLRGTLLADKEKFSWKQQKVEGFDWALEASSWSFRLWVSVRGFTSVDAAIAKKFINYSEAVITHHKSCLRKTHFLFLLLFQQLEEWDSVSEQCRRFAGTAGTAHFSSSPRGIILLDLQHGRTLRFDTQIRGKKLQLLLERIGTPA